jgi:actin-related protein 6
VTEPYFNLPNVQDVYDQFIFEEYEFQSYLRCCRMLAPPAHCAHASQRAFAAAALVPNGQIFNDSHLPAPECIIIVDAGFRLVLRHRVV